MDINVNKIVDEKIKKEFKLSMVTQLSTLVTAAFSFVAALAWNDTIKAWLDQFIKAGKGAVPLTIYAVIVTLIAVFASMFIAWIAQRMSK